MVAPTSRGLIFLVVCVCGSEHATWLLDEATSAHSASEIGEIKSMWTVQDDSAVPGTAHAGVARTEPVSPAPDFQHLVLNKTGLCVAQITESPKWAAYREHIHRSVFERQEDETISKGPGSGDASADGSGGGAPIIATCAGVTTRKQNITHLSTIRVFSFLLPSFVANAEPGFEYWLYLAYDAGDLFFDNQTNQAQSRAWIDEHITTPLKDKGIVFRFALMRFHNPWRKPGPAFNFLTRAAFSDGADYLYRLNDDTILKSVWAQEAVRALRGFSPPLLGAVGPYCRHGNQAILTHDIVHRQHLEIFEMYYPPVLTDWWLDDWMSNVYGINNTRKITPEVDHFSGGAGGGDATKVYSVEPYNHFHLEPEIRNGGAQISKWVSLQNLSTPGESQPPCTCSASSFQEGVGHFQSGQLRVLFPSISSAEMCCKHCSSRSACGGWSFVVITSDCYIHDSSLAWYTRDHPGVISGKCGHMPVWPGNAFSGQQGIPGTKTASGEYPHFPETTMRVEANQPGEDQVMVYNRDTVPAGEPANIQLL